MVTIMTVWSIYVAILFTNFYRSVQRRYMMWLEPFQAFLVSMKSPGMNMKMTGLWYDETTRVWKKYLILGTVRCIVILIAYAWSITIRWTLNPTVNFFYTFWAAIMFVWIFYSTNVIYLSYIYFENLAFYFRLRFNKVFNH